MKKSSPPKLDVGLDRTHTEITPRRVVYVQRSDESIQSWSHAVVWDEVHHAPAGKTELRVRHILRSDETRGAVYEIFRKPPFPRVEPSGVYTTPEAFTTYLRERLTHANGQASKDVYEVLGAAKPVIVVETRPEVQEDHEELYRRAAKAMECTVEALKLKYGHLNPGLQAMNLRNRLRARGQVV